MSGNGSCHSYTIKDNKLVKVSEQEFTQLKVPENYKNDFAEITWMDITSSPASKSQDGKKSSSNDSSAWNQALNAYREVLETEIEMLNHPDVSKDESYETFDIIDIDNDGVPELIFGSYDGSMASLGDRLCHYNPETGKKHWTPRMGPAEYFSNGYIQLIAKGNKVNSHIMPFAVYSFDYKTAKLKPLYQVSAFPGKIAKEKGMSSSSNLEDDKVYYFWSKLEDASSNLEYEALSKAEHDERMQKYFPDQAVDRQFRETINYKAYLESLMR